MKKPNKQTNHEPNEAAFDFAMKVIAKKLGL